MIASQEERIKRSEEMPIVGSLPDYPGILATMMISPEFETPLRALADALLVKDFKGATLTRSDRELIATAVSAGNNCFYCMDTHGAFAVALMQKQGMCWDIAEQLVRDVKDGHYNMVSRKMRELIRIALKVRDHARKLQYTDVQQAVDEGATDEDVQLAVLISAAFCMYNRMVDGMRARTPSDPTAYQQRARQIADFGYSSSHVTAIPD